jgi:signal transduction histidine kinase
MAVPILLISRKKFETETSRKAMEACEQIISEMGAELHDDLIQKLSALRLHLDKIERSSFDPAETQGIVNRMQSDFQGVVDAVRRISRKLLPGRMEEDTFETCVEMLCQNMETPGSLRIHTSFQGNAQKLPSTAEAYLLRMVQELIHNALRHSSAWHVWVTVQWRPGSLTIHVEDDGSGFSKLNEFIERLRKKHNSLRMRAQTIGAGITYKQGKKGLLAVIKYPLL